MGLGALAGLLALWQLTSSESEGAEKKNEENALSEYAVSLFRMDACIGRVLIIFSFQANYKQKLQGNYENRIRDFSTPEKIFIVSSSNFFHTVIRFPLIILRIASSILLLFAKTDSCI